MTPTHTLRVTLEARSPLLLGLGRQAGNVIEGHTHVPGAAVRGALAARWIAERGRPELDKPWREAFMATFEDGVHFGPAFVDATAVAPMSVLFCKYRAKPPCRFTAIDLTTEQSRPAVCPECGGPFEAGKGAIVGDGASAYEQTSVSREADRLFSRRGLPNRTIAEGLLAVGEGADLEWLTAQTRIRLGGRQSVAGDARINITEAAPIAPSVRADGSVVVRLRSPGVFVDDLTVPRLDPPEWEIETFLGAGTTLDQKWVRPTSIGGWHAASGLPKFVDSASAAGSTWLFRPESPPDPSALLALATHGLGLRTEEGLGAVDVNPETWRYPSLTAESEGETPKVRRDWSALDIAQRRWLARLARDRALGGSSTDHILDRPRFRKLSTEGKEAVRSVLALESEKDLKAAAIELEVSTWES